MSDVVFARELIRAQTLVRQPEAAQPNPRSFPAIGIEEDHALILKSNPDGSQGSLGDRRLPLSFSLLDRVERQARAPSQFGLGQAQERPSGTQLCGGDGSFMHRDMPLAQDQSCIPKPCAQVKIMSRIELEPEGRETVGGAQAAFRSCP
jgi:hypothetical protein